MRVITVANEKGGVAKTTSALNIACALGIMGKKVLFVDLDPQGNASSSLLRGRTTVNVRDVTPSVYELLTDEKDKYGIDKVARKTRLDNVDLIPSSRRMKKIEVELSTIVDSNRILDYKIKEMKKSSYDFIIIDTPPILTLTRFVGLFSTDEVIITTTPSDFASDGIVGLINDIAIVSRRLDKRISVGILYCRVEKNIISRQIRDDLAEVFRDYLYSIEIPEATVVKRAERSAIPVIRYAPKSEASKAYAHLVKEIINHANQ